MKSRVLYALKWAGIGFVSSFFVWGPLPDALIVDGKSLRETIPSVYEDKNFVFCLLTMTVALFSIGFWSWKGKN